MARSYAATVGVSVASSLGDILPTEVISNEVQLALQATLPWRQLVTWSGWNGPGLTMQLPIAASLTMQAITFTSTTATADATVAYDMGQRDITASQRV